MCKYMLMIIGLFAIILSPASPVLAEGPVVHEDPDEAKAVFSGSALLHYYSRALDTILQREPESTQATLEKMPFANVPSELEEATGGFAGSGTRLSVSIKSIYGLWQKENELLTQYQLEPASELRKQIESALPEARRQLWELTYSTESTGAFLKIPTGSEEPSGLQRTYAEVIDKLRRLEEMLNLFSKPLLDLEKLKASLTSDQIETIMSSGKTELLKDLLQPTYLTLEVSSSQIFVGDQLSFQGMLVSKDQPLGNREIHIMLNATDFFRIKTGSDGRYQGQLQVPYWYIPELEIQAFYYPQDNDAGVYLGSSSPLIVRNILYYQAVLTVEVINLDPDFRRDEQRLSDDQKDLVPIFRGQPVIVMGHFDYGEAPPIDRPGTGLYLDDSWIADFTAPAEFFREIELDPALALGKHVFQVSVPANGRYAPVSATCIIEIIQAAVTPELNLPGVAFIPLSLGVNGKLTSEAGPLNGAAINIVFNGTTSRAATSPDGSFDSRVRMNPGFSLLGSQKMAIQIQPREPWNAPLTVTRSIFVINLINCGLLLAIILVLGFYLPGRLVFKKRSKLPSLLTNPLQSPAPLEKKVESVQPGARRENRSKTETQANESEQQLEEILSRAAAEKGDGEQGKNVLGFYRLALRFVERLTRAILKPQQTLREYAQENRDKLGPVGQLFIEFTYMVERMLYSRHKPSGEELERSRRLSESIQGQAK